jgi:hypothetical protein
VGGGAGDIRLGVLGDDGAHFAAGEIDVDHVGGNGVVSRRASQADFHLALAYVPHFPPAAGLFGELGSPQRVRRGLNVRPRSQSPAQRVRANQHQHEHEQIHVSHGVVFSSRLRLDQFVADGPADDRGGRTHVPA